MWKEFPPSTPSSTWSRSASTACTSARISAASFAAPTSWSPSAWSASRRSSPARCLRTGSSRSKRSSAWALASMHRCCVSTTSTTTTSHPRRSTGCSRPTVPELRGSHGPGRTHLLTELFGTPDLHTFRVYGEHGGYDALEKALAQMDPGEVTNEVKTSGLRGRGGAGFPTGTKWGFMPPPDGGPRYVVVNADESEPGTAKDRYILENSPHMVLEGILIAAYAIQSHQAWIYIRGEYDGPYRMLTSAIAELRKEGVLGPKPFGKDHPFDIQLYRGHGAYICGEETALLESLEGKRAQPRSRPHYPAVKGAWGRPTLLNNVEKLATVPWIIRNGGAAYAAFGTERSKGTRLLTVSGHVRSPGVYEIELGIPMRQVIMELAGGPLPGHEIKCFWPGGSS